MSVSPIATTRSSSSSAARSCGPWKISTRSGSVLPYADVRSVSGVPEYSPSSVSGGSISMSARSSGDGSSSTTMAMFCIALRKRRGIEASASATSRSNSLRSTFLRLSLALPGLRGFLRRFLVADARDDETEVVAVVAHDTLIAERFGPADAPAVEDQRVGGARPPLRRHRAGQLRLDLDRVVAFRDADAVRHTQHVAIDRQSGDAKRVAEDDVGRLAPDARQLDERLHRGRHGAAMCRDERL